MVVRVVVRPVVLSSCLEVLTSGLAVSTVLYLLPFRASSVPMYSMSSSNSASTKTSSGKGEVNTTSIPTASSQVSPASADIVAASISHDTICAYIASQSNSSQIKYEDINQIDKDDIEEMDIKWNMALLSMRTDRF
nr:hypothetical protein [Tanacetum cinerariifolium]